jgi:hypothetical protein
MPEDFATELERLITQHRNAGTDPAEIREALTKTLDAEFDAMAEEAQGGEDEDGEDEDGGSDV